MRRRWLARLAQYLPHVVVIALVVGLVLTGALVPLDRALLDFRFRAIDRPATDDLVLVQVDAHSIAEIDVWPWSRALHAQVIDRVAEAGAREIAVDIDFSSRQDPGGDAALAQVLEQVGQKVILPVFRQLSTPDGSSDTVTNTAPLPMFREHVQLGGVNLSAASDGLVRTMPTTQLWHENTVATMPALLAGPAAVEVGRFRIDYGIDPASLKRHSFVDVLRGQVPDSAFAGQRVIVGSAATELGDQHAVPVHRVMHGPAIQSLAYESLIQGRTLQQLGRPAVLLAVTLLTLLLMPFFIRLDWRRGGAVALGAAGAVEASAYATQALAPVILPSAALLATIVLGYGAALARRIDLQSVLLFRQRMALAHRRMLMQRVLEDSFDGVLIADSRKRIEVANRTAGTLLGYKASELSGRNVADVLPNATAYLEEMEGQPDRESDASGVEHAGPFTLTLARPDGTTLPMELVISRCRAALSRRPHEQRQAGRDIYSFTFRDITERERALEAQRIAAEEAQAANRAKSEFLANMSHELRTPLNAIIGFSELMKEEAFGPLKPQYMGYAGDIHESGAHLLRVINDILDVSKIEAGHFTLNETSVEIQDLLHRCLRIANGWTATVERDVNVRVQPDLPLLRADAQLVKQSVINLLSNAIKYSVPGDRVDLRAFRGADSGLVIEVADTGIGIAEEHMDLIGTPFQQADSSLARRHEGSGLGLALVTAYMHAQDGEMELTSQLGIGTTVRLRFPAARCLSAHASGALADSDAEKGRDDGAASGSGSGAQGGGIG